MCGLDRESGALQTWLCSKYIPKLRMTFLIFSILGAFHIFEWPRQIADRLIGLSGHFGSCARRAQQTCRSQESASSLQRLTASVSYSTGGVTTFGWSAHRTSISSSVGVSKCFCWSFHSFLFGGATIFTKLGTKRHKTLQKPVNDRSSMMVVRGPKSASCQLYVAIPPVVLSKGLDPGCWLYLRRV